MPERTRRRVFYASVTLALAVCAAGALALVVLGVGSAGTARVMEIGGGIVLGVVSYALVAVIAVSRAGDPER